MNNFFSTKLIGDKIWSIDGPANDLMYLVVGSQRAMLIDTGMGIGDLARFVQSLIHIPLIVVNTHGHPDHAGGNSNFDVVWLPAKDDEIRRAMCSDEFRTNDLRAVMGEAAPGYQQMMVSLVRSREYQIKYLDPGQVIDLGDRQFEILEFPGHTPGSICLLNVKEKILFSGDSIVATPVWLFLSHSLPLQVYRDSLQRIKSRQSEFDIIFPGHQPLPLGREHLEDLGSCVEEILNNPGIGESTRTFAGQGLLWTFGNARIIYDLQKLF